MNAIVDLNPLQHSGPQSAWCKQSWFASTQKSLREQQWRPGEKFQPMRYIQIIYIKRYRLQRDQDWIIRNWLTKANHRTKSSIRRCGANNKKLKKIAASSNSTKQAKGHWVEDIWVTARTRLQTELFWSLEKTLQKYGPTPVCVLAANSVTNQWSPIMMTVLLT